MGPDDADKFAGVDDFGFLPENCVRRNLPGGMVPDWLAISRTAIVLRKYGSR
jgi:hypothetical protein